MKTRLSRTVAPTALPWSWSAVTSDCYILGARSLRYEGWPNFGQPVVCEVRYTVSVEEAEANRQLIIAAVNGCFAVNSANPLIAAASYPQIFEACRNLAAAAAHLLANWEKNLTEPIRELDRAVRVTATVMQEVLAETGPG